MSHRITVGEDITDLTSADTGFQIKFYGQRLCREFFFGNVRQHFRCINEDGVASGRSLVRNSVFIQFLCQVFHLLDTCFEIVEFGVFIQADGKSVHIPSVHSSIGEIAFVLYAETFCTFIPVCTSCGDKSTHIDDSVFLGTHCHAIG